MFCNGLRESHEDRVEIKGLDSGTMHLLLEYTYTSQAHLTHSNVQRILEAASQFQVTVFTRPLLLNVKYIINNYNQGLKFTVRKRIHQQGKILLAIFVVKKMLLISL